MNESGVRDVVLARAVEETDREGLLISLRARAAAAREGRARAREGGEAFLLARARGIIAPLVTEQAAVARVRGLAGRMAVPGWLAFALALVVGFAFDRLGGGEHVSILSFPLLGLLAWNLLAYAFFFLTQLGRLGSSSIRSSQSGWLARAMGWVAAPGRPWTRIHGAQESGLIAQVLERFLRDWSRAGAALHLARGRLAMHAAAAGLVLGVIAGMYLRGLSVEYLASWESTFLDPQQVRVLLAFVLGPAAALLGSALPDVETIEAMASTPVNAAIWIHLYSVTVLVAIILPRLGLALHARRRVRALAARLPIDWEQDPYFLRLFAMDRGAGARALVTPYSHRLGARASDELQALLLDLLGNRTRIDMRPAVEYGLPAQDSLETADELETLCMVLVFNLAQSPEQEVHGEYLQAVQAHIEALGELAQLLVVVDESSYAERLGGGEEAAERLESRRRAWQRVLRDTGVEALFLELDGSLKPDALGEAREALWPARAVGAGA